MVLATPIVAKIYKIVFFILAPSNLQGLIIFFLVWRKLFRKGKKSFKIAL